VLLLSFAFHQCCLASAPSECINPSLPSTSTISPQSWSKVLKACQRKKPTKKGGASSAAAAELLTSSAGVAAIEGQGLLREVVGQLLQVALQQAQAAVLLNAQAKAQAVWEAIQGSGAREDVSQLLAVVPGVVDVRGLVQAIAEEQGSVLLRVGAAAKALQQRLQEAAL